MRLVALAGPRNGHTAIYPYDQHPRPLRVYPIRVYAFPTGLHVVAAPGREALVGARLTTIDGAPIDRVVAAVRPLVPRDNPATVLDLLPEYVLTEEVLVGLGLTDGGEARLEFADGRSETFAPVAAPSFAAIGSILAPLRRPGATSRSGFGSPSERNTSRQSPVAPPSTSATTSRPTRPTPSRVACSPSPRVPPSAP